MQEVLATYTLRQARPTAEELRASKAVIDDARQEVTTLATEISILDSLRSETMYTVVETTTEPRPDSFGWFWERSNVEGQTGQAFVDWLETGDGILQSLESPVRANRRS